MNSGGVDDTSQPWNAFRIPPTTEQKNMATARPYEQNKQLYINRILHPDPDTQFAQPNELRVSQWEGVLPDDATFFTQLRFFQKFRPDRNFGHDPTFSLYFE